MEPHLIAEQSGSDVVVTGVPHRWVTHIRDFLDKEGSKYIVNAEAVSMVTGKIGMPHVFRFQNQQQRVVQALMDRFLQTHQGQSLLADLVGNG